MQKLLTIFDVADVLSVHPQTVRGWIKSGLIEGRKTGKEWRILESDLQKFIDQNHPRDSAKDIDLFKKSREAIWILGINALGPLHKGREDLLQALKRGVEIHVLIMNPDSQAFYERVRKEEYIPELNVISGRLKDELQASVSICIDIKNFIDLESKKMPDRKFGRILLRQHSEKPTKSLIIIDPHLPEGVCNVNLYPTQDQKRGLTGGQRTLSTNTQKENENGGKNEKNRTISAGLRMDTNEFIENVEGFLKLWKSAKKIDLIGIPCD